MIVVDCVSAIAAKLTDHREAIALLSIDKTTHVSLRKERESRLRRLRFEEARGAAAPGITKKYESFILEDDVVVFCLWIDNKHFARGVTSSTRCQIEFIKNVKTLSWHWDFKDSNGTPSTFFYIQGESASMANIDETGIVISDCLFHGGNMAMPRTVYDQFKAT